MADVPLTDPYEVLGLSRNADDAEVKKAYFQLVRRHSPERDPDKFQQIRAAYESLRSVERRARTDLFLLQEPPAMPGRREPSFDLAVHDEDIIRILLERFIRGRADDEIIREPDLP